MVILMQPNELYKYDKQYNINKSFSFMLKILNVSLCMGGSKGKAGMQLKCILCTYITGGFDSKVLLFQSTM